MQPWRSKKRQARRDIHREMGVPALLLPNGQGPGIGILIRGPHTKRPVSIGDLAGGGSGHAERVDIEPRLVFWRDQLPAALHRNDIISVEVGEAYRIERTEPPNDQTITAVVVPLTEAQATGLPVPSDGDVPSAPAMPGAAAFEVGFIHAQTTPASLWVVDHDLGYRPAVAVTLADGSEATVSVTHLSPTRLQIRFGSPETGQARCV